MRSIAGIVDDVSVGVDFYTFYNTLQFKREHAELSYGHLLPLQLPNGCFQSEISKLQADKMLHCCSFAVALL